MELLGQVNSADNLSQGAENLLHTLIDSFVENVTIGAAHLAMHRGSTAIKPEDVLLYLGLLRLIPTVSSCCPHFAHSPPCCANSLSLHRHATEQAWDIVLPETNGQEVFMNAATNPAFRPPPVYQTAPPEDSQSQILTTGMGGARHLERLSRLRTLKGSGRKEK